MELRDYQKEIVRLSVNVLKEHKFVYLAMEVRTGKTLTSLSISKTLAVSNVLFITKKKAISSIQEDYDLLNTNFNITIINYESLNKIECCPYDVIICDEAHGMGAYPKTSLRAKLVKSLIKLNKDPYVILLSGTPTPESYSQMYHQVFASEKNPFKQYVSFYKFSKDYVNVVKKIINSNPLNNYDDGKQEILDEMKPYMISYTQKEAGFKSEINEHVLKVKMSELTYRFVKEMREHSVIEGKKTNDDILGDTGVKKMTKIHKLCSGTVKLESGKGMVTDLSKAKFIHAKFKNQKIGIFYKLKDEEEAIKQG